MLRSYWILTLGLLVCLAGCGDEPAPEPSPEPLASAAAERPAPAPAVSDAASNASPRIDPISFEPDEPVLGDTLCAVVEISGNDEDTVWRDCSWTIDGVPVEQNVAEIRLDGPAFAHDKTLALSVFARDGRAQDHDSAEVELANAVPRLLAVEVEPSGDIHSSVPITLRPNARDADGDRNLRFQLENEPAGMTIDPIRGSVVWVPAADQDGKYRVSVVVDDRKGGETRHVIELNVAEPGEPPPPASLAQ